MTLRQPLRFGSRLLKRLVPAQNHDALLGDIAEERPRRSRFWYCSQLLAIVVVAPWRDVRSHPLMALRAVATGCVTLAAYFAIVLRLNDVIKALSYDGFSVGGHRITLPNPARLQPPYDAVLVLAISLLGFALAGWAIVRLHRAYGIAMGMLFLAIMTSMALIPLAIVLTDDVPGARSMTISAIIWTFGPLFLSVPGGILLGAYAATHREIG
jgi:hypothetical protein